jgi:hypothetical protein
VSSAAPEHQVIARYTASSTFEPETSKGSSRDTACPWHAFYGVEDACCVSFNAFVILKSLARLLKGRHQARAAEVIIAQPSIQQLVEIADFHSPLACQVIHFTGIRFRG